MRIPTSRVSLPCLRCSKAAAVVRIRPESTIDSGCRNYWDVGRGTGRGPFHIETICDGEPLNITSAALFLGHGAGARANLDRAKAPTRQPSTHSSSPWFASSSAGRISLRIFSVFPADGRAPGRPVLPRPDRLSAGKRPLIPFSFSWRRLGRPRFQGPRPMISRGRPVLPLPVLLGL